MKIREWALGRSPYLYIFVLSLVLGWSIDDPDPLLPESQLDQASGLLRDVYISQKVKESRRTHVIIEIDGAQEDFYIAPNAQEFNSLKRAVGKSVTVYWQVWSPFTLPIPGQGYQLVRKVVYEDGVVVALRGFPKTDTKFTRIFISSFACFFGIMILYGVVVLPCIFMFTKGRG